MRVGCWTKLVLSLTSIVAILQVIHLILLNRLEALHHRRFRGELDEAQPSKDKEEEAVTIFQALEESLRNDHVLDSTGVYRIAVNLPNGARQYTYSLPSADISLVTQCSHHHLHKLVPLASVWRGPISVAVYAEDHEVSPTLWEMARLRSCNYSVKENVTFSLVSPIPAKSAPPLTIPHAPPDNMCNFDNSSEGFENFSVKTFPTNLLRNVARRATTTEFVLVIDIDMVPNESLRQDFILMAVQKGLFRKSHRFDKTAFVVPVFEADERVKPPLNKAQLLALVETGEIRPFYNSICWKCQAPTNYDSWLKEPPGAEMAPLFDVLWKDPWEPFYIASNSAPFYDERFRRYGFNRISQVCELHVSGYTFSVLNNAFLVHRGFKFPNGFHDEKDQEQEENRKLFQQFKAELKLKYIDSTRRCY